MFITEQVLPGQFWPIILFFVWVFFSPALASVGYEKTCVLFNIGALSSQIASEQNLDNDEGLKTAAKFYQVRVSVYTRSQQHGHYPLLEYLKLLLNKSLLYL